MQTAIDKIRELRALHEDGLLSRTEFDLRKNAILDAAYVPAPEAAEMDDAPAPRTRPGTEIGLMAGQELGPQNRRYRLERLIAHGGMGQVWQATDLATHAELGHSAQVALKILPPQLTQSAPQAKLLIQEATRARRLAHENIVRVYEWAQDPATASYFIIMECLEGEDLDSLLGREGRLPFERVLALIEPVAAALDYAWDKHGLVHRDIKPGNVFVTKRGEVKLLDFGIAARARGSGSTSPLDAPSTSGTAGYRAPEAGSPDGQPAPTLDVYAVSMMIYQMLDGALPPALRASPASLKPHQWDALRAGCAQDPAARPPTVRALLENLKNAVGPSPEEIAACEAAERAAQERRARELAAQREAEEQAKAAARALLAQQRREQQRRERAAQEEARAARKEALRQQLLAKRDEELAKARLAEEEALRKAAQAKAAAAYLLEQKRARELQAARTASELQQLMPTPGSPVADGDGMLSDPFLIGAGSGPSLVLIPTGRFQMGSHEHERKIAMAAGAQKKWLERETPQRWVGIERPFAMGRYPVTVGEWRVFVQATSWEPQGEVNWQEPGFPQTDAHPVVGVTWHDAQRYVEWLTKATGKRYRLPSEAEWEYACRAGTRTAFSFGDTISPEQANYDGSFTYNGGPRGAYRGGTTPSGMFPPNPWGLYDMHGNVWEWVQDVVHDNYEGAPLDGSAWETGGDGARRILRGGSWLYNPRYLRSALRNGFSSVLSNDIVGFRVVRELI
ncbi:bifunctional serine/threonine-protein kinase/formylglycine-generating enzyme family protein [Massilia sp. IC2-477]|uniref:bifunctional serine/threonine-protein kinase/formylglycine-generating enzyme family protein n=1 Tax=Massilia sp. IC2-477 TaxID=2887198 RepID=UPI001D10AE20|nr:bifunctional serine/threonine-protein kinase/formylglycine-generating enzyme family protein [Massilia sp. IC2-477]MCC2955334.1 bifunctional serine/threonine-protein kinase/formylglycine-generating enzyme family protein [Massilia sp. IC2-477]